MVSSLEKNQQRLTIQTVEIALDTIAIRSLDWDRDRFDIEFSLENGTTYNSYLIKGEKTALVDTSHGKFRQLYLKRLKTLIDTTQIDYLVISHTEPDHSGLVKEVIQLAPQVTVVASKMAIQFLENQVHLNFNRQIVKNGDLLDLGKGHILEFVSAPNLHWPDTIFTYDSATQTLFSCDGFGMHYCSDATFDEDLSVLDAEYQTYYQCLMAPNARSVVSALKRMENLGQIKTIANGHGPILRHHLKEMIDRYRRWSQIEAKAETLAVVFYTSNYGYSDRLSQAIARGLGKTGVAVEMVDLRTAEVQQIHKLVGTAKGIVVGTPPALDAMAIAAVDSILGAAKMGQKIGLFESYGGDDEPIDSLIGQFKNLGLSEAFPPIRIKDSPTETTYKLCEEAGTDIGQALALQDNIESLKSINPRLEKALGRISGGLYIITAAKGEVKSGMLASWVAKASRKPPGLTVAVAKDRAIESLMQVGDRFVLNILEEGNYQHLMKHFLKRFSPGADRFADLDTQKASNGCPILTDALAYLECQVKSRMECTDHWIVYATVEVGEIAKADALTAVHHRKVGNHY
jgi:flavorubredoxin/flavin reductase (DIM6/NTAB) family NADH-FMN oxidoreductase RutF